MNSIHNNIKFTKEEEIEVSYLPFINIKITKEMVNFEPERTTNQLTRASAKIGTALHHANTRKQLVEKSVSSQIGWFLCWQTSWKRFPMVRIMIQKRFQLWERWKYFWFFRILVSRRYALKRVSLPFFVQSAYNQIDFKVVFKTTRRLSDLFRI